ncbi:MAG: DUF5666 domain-containing protein [Acidobacteriota bacterium]
MATALAPVIARAHDPKKHKGNKTDGEIVSVAEDRLVLKTKKGSATVLLSENPKIERGDLEVSRAALRRGDRVTVIGTTLASGEIVAREILVAAPRRDQPPQHSGHSGHPH